MRFWTPFSVLTISLLSYSSLPLQGAGRAKNITNRLKRSMQKQGMDPALIDDPDAVLPNQVGSEDKEIKNDAYAKGLRYCVVWNVHF